MMRKDLQRQLFDLLPWQQQTCFYNVLVLITEKFFSERERVCEYVYIYDSRLFNYIKYTATYIKSRRTTYSLQCDTDKNFVLDVFITKLSNPFTRGRARTFATSMLNASRSPYGRRRTAVATGLRAWWGGKAGGGDRERMVAVRRAERKRARRG